MDLPATNIYEYMYAQHCSAPKHAHLAPIQNSGSRSARPDMVQTIRVDWVGAWGIEM
jgi:hypothetical protein